MAVVNGNPVEANYTNSKLASKTADNNLQGKQTLSNGDVVSGATINNAQRYINEIAAAVGVNGEGDASVNNYASNNYLVDGQNRKQSLETIDAAIGIFGSDITDLQNDLAAEIALQASNHSAQAVQITNLQNDVADLRIKKYTIDYSDFTAAALTEDIELFSMPAKGMIKYVLISHNTKFDGPSCTLCKANVGLSGDLKKYSSDFDAFSTPADGNYQMVEIFDYPSKISSTSVRVSIESDVNLNTLTQGQLEIHVMWSLLP
jgi:hypothetical protein